jgi:hypothetical protein
MDESQDRNNSDSYDESDSILDNHLKKSVKGIQLNMRKSEVATTNLIKTCEKLNSYVLFLQEPRTIYKKVSIGHNTKMHYETHKHVRAAIGHSKDLNILGIPTLTDRDTVTCQWIRGRPDQTIILISAYWDATCKTRICTTVRS